MWDVNLREREDPARHLVNPKHLFDEEDLSELLYNQLYQRGAGFNSFI